MIEHSNSTITFRGVALAATATMLGLASCVSTSSGIAQSTQGCPELDSETIGASATLDVKVRAFMQASADLRTITNKMKAAVHDACVHVATDLGAPDTWSGLAGDDAIANKTGTGACDVARARMVSIMESAEGKAAGFALVVARGACHEDFDAETKCEAGCSAETKCDSGKVEERCEPGALSVQCTERCAAQSWCEGRVDLEASCSGQCEAKCHGSCSGTCIDEMGRRTENDANCNGKCTAKCTGKCAGRCQIQETEGVACGASVSCNGSCTSTYSNPVCETMFTPPKCTIDETCFESCRTSVAAKAVCDPPTVTLEANTQVGPNVAKLVATINANLPPLVAAAEQQGQLVVKVGGRLAATGKVVLDNAGNLDGKSLGCATAAAKLAADTSSSLQISANASVDVTQACRSHAE